ncbi:hypothetical protein M407DRAFT_99573 [Tulasnella calospora MUT 4182]|uniref:Uncharacterized protein n=1 Tax=Tulasnella calospora MUT 4182 TaxID=1051891 RepID=A0A0C3QGC1_9AGAM|nr:hypothetical protein M407DRAFT_99573 [Tulasnella calospora MUT 4182]
MCTRPMPTTLPIHTNDLQLSNVRVIYPDSLMTHILLSFRALTSSPLATSQATYRSVRTPSTRLLAVTFPLSSTSHVCSFVDYVLYIGSSTPLCN